MSTPKYVRLASRLSRGIVADVQGSGWSIAGLDVKEFPTGAEAAKFVKRRLDAGILEPASKAEWEDVHDEDTVAATMRAQHPNFGNAPQEAQVQRAAQEAREKLEAKRGDTRDPEEVYDEEVRQPRLARAKGGELPEDLDDLSKDDLVKLAEQRGLSKSGTKAELIERLEESEEEDEEEDDDSDEE